jgi:HlyD family secretion protein
MRKRRGFWIGIVVVALVAGGLFLRSRGKNKTEELPFDAVTVERGTVTRMVTADGVLKALTEVQVKSYAGGEVQVLAVDVGDVVKAGDLIAEIDPTDSRTTHEQALADLSVARANLAQARAQLRVQSTLSRADITVAQAGYSQAESDLSKLTEASQPQTRAQASATLEQATAALDSATRELERLKLADHPQGVAEASSAVERYTAALDAAEKDLAKLQEADQPQEYAEAKSQRERAVAALTSAEETLDRLRRATHPQGRVQASSDLATARSELEVAGKELDRARALRAEGLISQSELDATQSAFEARQASFQSAEEIAGTIDAAQSSEIRSAEMSVAQAQADLASAEERWRTLGRGQSTEVEASVARVVQARADLSSAAQRLDTLDEQQDAELRVAEAKVVQAKADLMAAQQRWDTLNSEQVSEVTSAESRVRESGAAVDRAEAQQVEEELRRAEEQSARAQVEKAQAAVRNAATMLGYTTIVAPRDGVILERYVEEGTIVTSGRSSVTEGTSLVLLGDVSRMYVEVEIDEADLGLVHVGQDVRINVEAFDEDEYMGRVTRVDPQALTTTSITTVLVEAELLDLDDKLIPGLTASCDFMVDEVDSTLRLPIRAVDVDDDAATVRVMVDGVVQRIPVEVGLEGDEFYEIVSGVSEGDEVMVPRFGSGQSGPPSAAEMGRRMSGGLLAR